MNNPQHQWHITEEEAVKNTNIDVEKAMRDNPGTPVVPPQKIRAVMQGLKSLFVLC